VLRPRARYRHVERMVRELKERYAELSRPVPTSAAPVAAVQQPAGALVDASQPSTSYAPAAQPVSAARPASGVARDPFFANAAR
jgi:hypothetical protein